MAENKSNNIDFTKFKKTVFKHITPSGEIPTAKYLRNMGRARYFSIKHINSKLHSYTKSANRELQKLTPQDKAQAQILYMHSGNSLNKLGKHANMYLHHVNNYRKKVAHYTVDRSRKDFFKSRDNSKKVQSYDESLNKDKKYMSDDLKKKLNKKFAGLSHSDIDALGRKATKYLRSQKYHKSYSRNFLRKTMGHQHDFHKPQHFFSKNASRNTKKSYQPKEHTKKQVPKKNIKKQQAEIKQAKNNQHPLPF